jgi:hypothetical protein
MVNTWEQTFLGSIKASAEKYKSLTVGQHNTLVGIEARYNPAAVAARNEWAAKWDEQKKNDWKFMIDYYSKTPYYKGATDKVKANPEYIPSENEYKAICENKYAVRMLKNRDIPPKFRVGQLVVYKRYGSHHLATVITVGELSSWSKGSREYNVMLVGEANKLLALEKELLYYRDALIPKLEKKDDTPF